MKQGGKCEIGLQTGDADPHLSAIVYFRRTVFEMTIRHQQSQSGFRIGLLTVVANADQQRRLAIPDTM